MESRKYTATSTTSLSSDDVEAVELKQAVKIQIQHDEDVASQSTKSSRRKFRGLLKRAFSTKNKVARLVGKSGNLKVVAASVPSKHAIYFSDLFTTMIDAKWRWICFTFLAMYVGSWLFFGVLWYLITIYRGNNKCVDNVFSFTSAYLFSLETQTTIGYGGRQITPDCPEAVLLLNFQSLVGFIINAVMLGLVFGKLSRPRNRAETILFSTSAVIALRDGKMCLMFRVGDVRKSQILDAHIRVQLFRTRVTAEGRVIPFFQQDIKCGIDWSEQWAGYNSLFIILPLTIIHVIDKHSPFYEMRPSDLCDCEFEIIAILEGTVEATGMLTQAKTSYTSDEICWGYEFRNIIGKDRWSDGRYRLDFSAFDDIYEVRDTPFMSAKEYYRLHPFDMDTSSNDSESVNEKEFLGPPADDENDVEPLCTAIEIPQQLAFGNGNSVHLTVTPPDSETVLTNKQNGKVDKVRPPQMRVQTRPQGAEMATDGGTQLKLIKVPGSDRLRSQSVLTNAQIQRACEAAPDGPDKESSTTLLLGRRTPRASFQGSNNPMYGRWRRVNSTGSARIDMESCVDI